LTKTTLTVTPQLIQSDLKNILVLTFG